MWLSIHSHSRLSETPKNLSSWPRPQAKPGSSCGPRHHGYVFPGTASLAPRVGSQHPSQALLVWTRQLRVLLWLCPDTSLPRILQPSSGILKPQLQVQWLFPPIQAKSHGGHSGQSGWLASHQVGESNGVGQPGHPPDTSYRQAPY